ncbi:Cytochrome c peroxidase [Venturia nashicola]|nr:Cytochrome c peroxidase [Venturia nashicola]
MRKAVKSLLSILCFVACCPLCFPCYICAFKNRRKRNRQNETREIDHWRRGPRSPAEVHPLPSRKRRLSIAATTERPVIALESAQKVCMQEQALIFTRLPPEIRAQIWQEVVGEYEIYLGIVSKTIRHCKIFGGLGIARCDIDEQEQDRLQAEHKLLPLLKTCRRIYSEAIPVLYSTNKFTTSHIEVIPSLTSTIRLPRFNSISSLSVTWSLPTIHRIGMLNGLRHSDAKTWDRASRTMASMKGLKTLRITVWGCTIYGASRDWTGIRQLLDLLTRIKQPRNYIVSIDELEAEELVKEYDGAPFKLDWSNEDTDVMHG